MNDRSDRPFKTFERDIPNFAVHTPIYAMSEDGDARCDAVFRNYRTYRIERLRPLLNNTKVFALHDHIFDDTRRHFR